VDVRQLGVQVQSFTIEVHCFLGALGVVVGVAQTYQGLELFLIHC
jgi:hypothetical protein